MVAGRPRRKLVTVVLPTFNNSRYLAEAIDSILLQSCEDLNLAILDGGSTDGTIDIAKAFRRRDRRVSVHVFPGAHPCTRVDHFLMDVKTPFIAIQHSDDVSYRYRLALQLKAFAADPDLGVCSAVYRSFWHNRLDVPKFDGDAVHAKPERHAEIKANLLFWWVMHCPTLMFRRDKMQAAGWRFENDFQLANDYWTTVSFIDKLKHYNIQEELSAYRLHGDSDGSRNVDALRAEERILKRKIVEHFGFRFSEREYEIHDQFRIFPDGTVGARTPAEFAETLDWLDRLTEQNRETQVFDGPVFEEMIDRLKARTEALARR